MLAAIIAGALPHRLAMAQPGPAEAPPSPSAPAPAMTDEARAFYDRGLRRYAEKDYAAAIAEFQAGYAVEPRREFLFAEAQAKRLAGDCPGAVGLYQKFLESRPSPAQVNATQMGLARCAQQMAAIPAPPAIVRQPDPLPRATAPATSSDTQPATPSSSSSSSSLPAPPAPRSPVWYRDPLGATLLGAGVLGLGIAAGFLAASFAARDAAPTYAEYERHWQTAEGRWKVGMVGLAAGGLLTGAAIARYALVRRRARSGFEVSATVAPATTAATTTVAGGVLLVGGRF